MSLRKEQKVMRDKFNSLIAQRAKLLKDIEELYDEAKQVEDYNLQEWIREYIFKYSGSYAPFFVPLADVKELK